MDPRRGGRGPPEGKRGASRMGGTPAMQSSVRPRSGYHGPGTDLLEVEPGMKRLPSLPLTCGFVLVLAVLSGRTPESLSAELKSEALEAFNFYVRATEARINKELARAGAFLFVEWLPEAHRSQVRAALKRGDIYIERLKTPDSPGQEIRAPGALIHHWMGAVFIPHASLRQAIDFVQDYNHHAAYYRPEMVGSRLIARNGNDFKIFYRLRKHKIITVTLNTEHDVRYTVVDSSHCYSRSYSTRIAQVENADRPEEREKPPGRDDGFLWRVNSYWRFEEGDGGVYVECESVSLTRDIPLGLAWLIGPFVTGIPKESLEHTLGSTRSGLLQRVAAVRHS